MLPVTLRENFVRMAMTQNAVVVHSVWASACSPWSRRRSHNTHGKYDRNAWNDGGHESKTWRDKNVNNGHITTAVFKRNVIWDVLWLQKDGRILAFPVGLWYRLVLETSNMCISSVSSSLGDRRPVPKSPWEGLSGNIIFTVRQQLRNKHRFWGGLVAQESESKHCRGGDDSKGRPGSQWSRAWCSPWWGMKHIPD